MIVAVTWLWQLLVCTVGLALVAGPGLAATTLSCTPFEPEMVPGVRLRFPYEPFDPALGTLDEVTVTVQGRVFGQALINAPPGSPLPYHFTITHELSADLGRSFTFLGGERANFEFSGQSIPLVPFAYSRVPLHLRSLLEPRWVLSVERHAGCRQRPDGHECQP